MASDKKLLALAEAIKNKYGITVDVSKLEFNQVDELTRLKSELDALQNKGRYQNYSGDYKVNFYPGYSDRALHGYYDPAIKKEININSQRYSSEVLPTLIHERQHLIDNELQPRASTFPLSSFYGANGRWPSKTTASESLAKGEYVDSTNKLISAYKKYGKKYNLPGDFITDPWVELTAIERQLPAGKGIMDTDIGQDLFKDNPMFKAMYYNLTANGAYMSNPLPQENRSGPPAKPTEKGLFEAFQDWVRMKTRY